MTYCRNSSSHGFLKRILFAWPTKEGEIFEPFWQPRWIGSYSTGSATNRPPNAKRFRRKTSTAIWIRNPINGLPWIRSTMLGRDKSWGRQLGVCAESALYPIEGIYGRSSGDGSFRLAFAMSHRPHM